MSTSPQKGPLFVILAAVLWAVSGSSAKFLFHSGITPFQLVQMRLTIASIGLFLWLYWRHRRLLKIDRSDIRYFIVLGTVGIAGVQSTYLFTISKIHVAAAILLQYLAPAFIAIHAVLFFKDRLSIWTTLALIGAFFGCYLVVGAYNLNMLNMNLAGIVSGVLSGLTFAWYSVHGEYGMRRYNPWTVIFYGLLFAAVTWNILYPPLTGFRHVHTPVQWGWVLYIGVLGTLMPFGLYLEGVNLIRSTRASIIATLEPITAGVLSYLFLNEVMSALQLFGGVLVIASIVLLHLKQEMDLKAPALIRARKEEVVSSPGPDTV